MCFSHVAEENDRNPHLVNPPPSSESNLVPTEYKANRCLQVNNCTYFNLTLSKTTDSVHTLHIASISLEFYLNYELS
jgi:hypothetical protein